MNEMTEFLLRLCLKEAEKKGQTGLLIWAGWSIWDEMAYKLEEGNEDYDFILSQVEKQEEATLTTEWAGLKMPGCLAVPVKKLRNSEKYFEEVLDACRKNHYMGPVTLLPLNEVADYF